MRQQTAGKRTAEGVESQTDIDADARLKRAWQMGVYWLCPSVPFFTHPLLNGTQKFVKKYFIAQTMFVWILEWMGMPTDEGVVRAIDTPLIMNKRIRTSAIGRVIVHVDKSVYRKVNSGLENGVVQHSNVVPSDPIRAVTSLTQLLYKL